MTGAPHFSSVSLRRPDNFEGAHRENQLQLRETFLTLGNALQLMREQALREGGESPPAHHPVVGV